MELSTVTQMITKNHIPLFGVESKSKPKKASGLANKTASKVEDRSCLVAECAYYKAEARGFEPGHELEDWLAAEAEVSK